MPAVSWPWVPAWGSLEPPRRDGENAQKTRKNREKIGEIQPKRCEGRELTKDQLAKEGMRDGAENFKYEAYSGGPEMYLEATRRWVDKMAGPGG